MRQITEDEQYDIYWYISEKVVELLEQLRLEDKITITVEIYDVLKQKRKWD